jgi:hypothetical protein
MDSAVASLFRGLPTGGNERATALAAIRTSFYAELGRQFRPVLNEFAKAQCPTKEQERSELATTLNRMAKNLGLSVVCPRSGLPATIVADTKRAGDSVTMRYRFYTVDTSGHRSATYTCSELPELDVCQAPHRVESLAKGFRKIGRDDGRAR